ncbi:hypothetical protein, partial [Oceaniglobus indicus]|uniref:hypothetical protein n=1 Tax=Oceaniglobus indicus TaxID=2047749 RepID=UPI0019D4A8B7
MPIPQTRRGHRKSPATTCRQMAAFGIENCVAGGFRDRKMHMQKPGTFLSESACGYWVITLEPSSPAALTR